ncbi:MAG: hypothetical protein WBJ41_18560 [Chromatiaceae bacterium]
MTIGRRTGLDPRTWTLLVILAAPLVGCACRPDARLHQQPAAWADLPESLMVGIACLEILPSWRAPRHEPR